LKTFIKILVLLITIFQINNVLAADSSPSQKRSITKKDIDDAAAIAMKWLELLDNQKYKEAYALLDTQSKVEIREVYSLMAKQSGAEATGEQWCKDQEIAYLSYGKTASRKKLSAEVKDEIIGFKEGGDYIEVQFKTTFENHEQTFNEIVIMTAENKEWKPSIHLITSSQIRRYKKLQSFFNIRENEKIFLAKLSQKDMNKLLGSWQGKGTYGGILVFQFKMSKDGEFTGVLSFADREGYEVPITDIGMSNGRFVCTIKGLLAKFTGKLTDKEIVGEMVSTVYPDTSLTLTKGEYVAKVYKLNLPKETMDKLLGTWNGKLIMPGTSLPWVFRFENTEKGEFVGFNVPPGLGGKIPVTSASLSNSKLTLELGSVGGEFRGQLSGDKLTGDWIQGGERRPLSLVKERP
jgi:hypothetical protein